MRTLIIILGSLALVPVCEARIITVDDDGPADFDNIQAADTVIVADGTYQGPGNRNIDFLGKAITVRSENGPDTCIIDCQSLGRGFSFRSGEGADSVLAGLTITNGNGPWDLIFDQDTTKVGGGVYVWASSPTIDDCIITSNLAGSGGGICCSQASAPTITGCRIVGNRAQGGGIYCADSSPTIINCQITNNTAPIVPGFPGPWSTAGGGIYSSLSSPLVINCNISENTATAEGGGIKCYTGGDPTKSPILRNCIISGNNAASYGDGLFRCKSEISNCIIAYNGGYGLDECGSQITNCIVWGNGKDLYKSYPTYSCIEDGDPGEGNIQADPCFAHPDNGDYHLKSQAGRWDPNAGTWVIDDVTSPCIDAGNPASPIGSEPFPNGGLINMGAYGTIIAGDINGDCVVDFRDLSIAMGHWLEER